MENDQFSGIQEGFINHSVSNKGLQDAIVNQI